MSICHLPLFSYDKFHSSCLGYLGLILVTKIFLMDQVPPHPHPTPSPEEQTQTLHKPGKGSTADLHPQPSTYHLLKKHSYLYPLWFPFKHTT